MLGKFQKSELRIEIEASASVIRDSLLRTEKLKKWLWSQQIDNELPEELYKGYKFTSGIGPLKIYHQVDVLGNDCLRLILSQGIDGYHEWYWGEGWVQSRLEGVSMLPISLGQTLSLLTFREFVKRDSGKETQK
jgi:hypothetical protein